MDKMIFTSLNSIQNLYDQRFNISQNWPIFLFQDIVGILETMLDPHSLSNMINWVRERII